MLTRAPLYAAKAALMPGATFVLGHDTAVRLLMPKYYGGERGMFAAFNQIRAAGCSFIVAGRAAAQPQAGSEGGAAASRFLTLADVDVPEALADLFEAMPEFRLDVSSSELRAAAAAEAAAVAAEGK